MLAKMQRCAWLLRELRFTWRLSCMDCGVNVVEAGEYFVVEHHVWRDEAMLDPHGGTMCIGCLEQRLGRMLSCLDFALVPVNTRAYWRESGRWPSARFAHRLKRRPTRAELMA